VLAGSTVVLPALAWAASHLIGNPVLRSGMQTVGVAALSTWAAERHRWLVPC
jgi:hypothetical protein